jgi:hypothetical protein
LSCPSDNVSLPAPTRKRQPGELDRQGEILA